MKISDFTPYNGQHCETTATGSLLSHIGIQLSEPMLFGLGEGLSYIFWNMKIMDFPFIGGRVKPDILTENICRNLNLHIEVKETSSVKKAWTNVKTNLDNSTPVGLKMDCYHLDYFTNKIHFAGHYASIYGYDNVLAYLNDTNQQGRDTKTTLKSLELARNEKGPMSSRNRSYTISRNGDITPLSKAIKAAITNNATEYLNPPISNISYKGIKKTAAEIKKWFSSSKNIKSDFQTSATLMERAGTGGAIFRNLYRDFLLEAFEILYIDAIKEAHNAFILIAQKWTQVSELFYLIGETEDLKYVHEAADILTELSIMEKAAMEPLKELNSYNFR